MGRGHEEGERGELGGGGRWEGRTVGRGRGEDGRRGGYKERGGGGEVPFAETFGDGFVRTYELFEYYYLSLDIRRNISNTLAT